MHPSVPLVLAMATATETFTAIFAVDGKMDADAGEVRNADESRKCHSPNACTAYNYKLPC